MNRTIYKDCREAMQELVDQGVKVQSCITSPPYWGLRDYGKPGQIGLEPVHDCQGWATGERCGVCHVCVMVNVFRLVKMLFKDDGTVWLNYGDSYYSPRCNGGIGSNSKINGKHSQIEYRKASAKRRGGSSGNLGYEHQDTNSPNRRRGLGSLKPKDLVLMPSRIALALQADGWYVRQDIIWHKTNPMPESVKDRCTKSHEYLFLLAKSEKYFNNMQAISEPAKYVEPNSPKSIKSPHGQGFTRRAKIPNGWDTGPGTHKNSHRQGRASGTLYKEESIPERKNKRSVWTISTTPYSGAHFATFPKQLVEPCILAGTKRGDTILDPFMGSGTVALMSEILGRNWIGIDINENNHALQQERFHKAERHNEAIRSP